MDPTPYDFMMRQEPKWVTDPVPDPLDSIPHPDNPGEPLRQPAVDNYHAGASPAGNPTTTKWWDMSYDDSVDPVEIDIADGMNEGATHVTDYIHPQLAWGNLATTAIAQQTVVNGTTHFYVKATFTGSTVDMGTYTPTSDAIEGWRYDLDSVEVVKVTGTPPEQPADTKLVKHKLLGIVTVADDLVTEYWWRTNHVFNWTFYHWTTLVTYDVSNVTLPPDAPPVP